MEEELIRTLQATLEPNASVILAAQNHLEQHLHQQPQAGLSLVNIVHAGPAIPLAIRQAAAVNLSLWIKQRWGPFFTEFVGFPARDGKNVALSVEDKEPVRQALLSSISLDEVKLRGPMIKALVNVASCDWPDEFPSLLPKVQDLLTVQASTSQGLVSISGALSFLDDWFYNSMDETGLMSITSNILPDLERILTNAKLYPAPVRCRCISIFNQMLETLWMVKEQYPEASKTVAAEIMPRWLSTLEAIVAPSPFHQIDEVAKFGQAQGEEFALQAQAWLTISTATHFPAHIKQRLPTLVSTALSVLSVLQTPFHFLHISSAASDNEADTASDFYTTPSSLAAKIIDFVGVATQSYPSLVIDASTLSIIVPLLRSYSRITSEEQEEWQENVSAFVAAGEEDDAGAMATAMRARCADILSELILVKEQDVLEALRLAVTAAHEEGSQRRQKGEEDWWKEEEASLSLVGGIAEHIVEKLEDAKEAGQPASFDVESIFALSVLPNTSASSPYFLYGRCFVFASQFASILPEHLANNFLEAAVGALEQEASGEGDAIVKLSAVRCIKNFHRHLSQALLRPFSARILSRLGPLLDASSEDTLVLIVETLQAVAMQDDSSEAGQSIPPNVYGDIVSECIRAWAKEASDRVLQTTIEDLLEAFAAHESAPAALAVVQRAFTLCGGLLGQEQSAQDDRYRSSVIVEGSLEFAGAVARGATTDVLSQSGTVLPFLGPLFDTLNKSDDREVYKNGAVLLTSLISKMPDEILAWHDAHGVASLQHILTLISNMISPQDTSESGGLAVGDLLTIILRRRPEALSSNLPQLCTALASRLATSASTSLTQSLIVPLAYLMKDHLDTVVALLQAHGVTVDSDVVPSLQILLKRWCEFAGSFQGFWNTRVSSLGLCALLKQAKGSGIDSIIVDGDLIPDKVNIIKTRSRAKLMPNRYTQIPASAKILKILVNEYTQSVDGPPSQSGKGNLGDDDGLLDDNDDDDDEWNDDEEFVKKQKRDALFADMGFGDGDLDGGLEDMFAQFDEEQYHDDAIYNMPFRSYLSAFFRELAQDGERAAQLANHLTQQEVTILHSAIA